MGRYHTSDKRRGGWQFSDAGGLMFWVAEILGGKYNYVCRDYIYKDCFESWR